METMKFREKARDLEKELLELTTSMRSARNEKEFNELLEGAIVKLENSRIR